MRETLRLLALSRKLTARERAVLYIRSWRADAALDDAVLGLMPRGQRRAFGQHIGMTLATMDLAPYAELLYAACLLACFAGGARLQEPSGDVDRDMVSPFLVLWARMLAWEQFCGELVDEFGDPVVIEPGLRVALNRTRTLLVDWQALIKAERPRLRLPKADPEELQALHQTLAARTHKWD